MLKNNTILLTCLSLLLFGCGSEPEKSLEIDPTTERQLVSGWIVGVEGEHNNHSWLGLPYAAPPVGNLRWLAPQPEKPWRGLKKANKHGAICTQFAGSAGGQPGEAGTVVGDEDCLYLSVYAPKLNESKIKQKKLPVMVWFHGGSNRHGAGSFYDGSRLANEQEVIVVSINYRLGPFGWFYHSSLNHASHSPDASELDNSGNYGTLDILQSLKWVQNNIEVFGGDSNNVTVFGESAGAFDILSLMISPLAEGLFHKAISQSGGINLAPISKAMNYQNDKEAGDPFSSQQIGLYLRVQDGSANNVASAKKQVGDLNETQRASYLRAKSATDLMLAYGFDKPNNQGRSVNLIADGFVLPTEDPMELFADPKKHLDVPLLIGTNRDEMRLYLFSNKEYVDYYFSYYPVIKDESFYEASADYYSRMWKYNGVDRVAKALSESRAKGSTSSVWAYRFDWDEQARPLGAKLDKLLGAGHGMEIPFVFGFTSKDEVWQKMHDDSNKVNREQLSKTMRNYWAEFAYRGNPGSGRDQRQKNWPAWDGDSDAAMKYMILDSPQDGGMRMSADLVSFTGMVKDIAEDDRLDSVEKKCKVFAELVKDDNKAWPNAAYEGRLEGACAAYPL